MISAALILAGLSTAMSKMIARSLATNNLCAARQNIRIGVITVLASSTLAIIFFTNQPGYWLLSQLKNEEQLYDNLVWIAAMAIFFAAVGFCCGGFNEISCRPEVITKATVGLYPINPTGI